MPTLTISGTVIPGVQKAIVRVAHSNPKAPDPIPMMEFDIISTLQFSALLPTWATAAQSTGRFKNTQLVIKNKDASTSQTYVLLNSYLHLLEVVEHPDASGVTDGAGIAGYFVHMIIRGHAQEPTRRQRIEHLIQWRSAPRWLVGSGYVPSTARRG
jgi:hypothetical protein